MELSKEILESIDKQLTKDAAGRLAEFIKNASLNESKLKDQARRIELLEIKDKEKNEIISSQSLILEQAKNVAKGLDDLKRKEFEHELNLKRWELDKEIYKYKFDLLTTHKADIKSIVDTLVKNPRAVEIMSQLENHSMSTHYDGQGRSYPWISNSSKTANTEIKETKD